MDAAVLDIITTSTYPVDSITMSDSTTAYVSSATTSVASATARTYKSSGRVLEFGVDDEKPMKNPFKPNLSSRRNTDLQ